MPVHVNDAPLAFSAASLGQEAGRAEAVCRIARALGLGYVKLGPCLQADPPDEAAEALSRERIRVVAVQNVYTTDSTDGADLEGNMLSDPRSHVAEQAMAWTISSAAAAKRFGTDRVILHLGDVRGPRIDELRRTLEQAGEKGGEVPEEAREAARQGLALVTEMQEPWLDRTIRVLHRLLKSEPEITFCIENRPAFHQIPGLEALGFIFEDLKSSRLAYWHNTGFAQVQESLGLAAAGDWLDRYAPRLAGVHLQDAAGFETHLPPGTGRVDFRGIRRALPSGIPRVMDLRPGTTPEEFRFALQELKLLGY